MNPLRWDTMLARAILSAAAGMAILTAGAAQAQLPPALDDTIASRDAGNGAPAGGQVGAVSGDGRYVLFQNGTGLYRRDRLLGVTVRVDLDAAGQPDTGLGPSFPPSISADGRYVSFDSHADYGTGDSNFGADIYVKDMNTGAIERVSVKTGGADITDGSSVHCNESSISGNGSRVAFVCREAGFTNVVFVRDRQAAVTAVVSINTSLGITTGSVSQSPSISLDGRYVGFVSDAANLVAGDGNASRDAFVRDLQANSTMRVSLTDADAELSGADVQHVDIGGNCLAAFDADAAFAAFDNNGDTDIYVRNWCDGVTSFASATDNFQVPTGGPSYKPSLSDDGRYVAFTSNAQIVSAFNFTGGSDVYVRDRQTGGVARANLQTVEGQDFDTFAIIARLSGDGRQVIYTAAGGSISDQILAVRNPVAALLPVEDVDVTAFGTSAGRDSFAASLTSDGNKVVFVSSQQGFDRGWGGNDADAVNDVFVYDYALGCTEQASMSDGTTNGDCDGDDTNSVSVLKGCAPPQICSATIEPSIDAFGLYAVFVTNDGAVAKYRNETETQRKARLSSKAPGFAVVLRNLVTNATFRIGNATAGGNGSTPRVEPGGGSIVFASGSGLAGGDVNGQNDIYRQRINPDGSPNGAPACISCKDGALDLPGGAGNPTINAGGTVVAFDQPNGLGGRDIVIRNLINGSIQRAGTTAPAGTRVNTQPSIDWSGTRIAFQTGASLLPNDANAFSDVYVYETLGGRLALMSGGNGPSSSPSFAGDGKSLAYVTEATDLDPAETDANGYQDVHAQQITGSFTGGRRATLARNRRGALTNGASHRPAMSYNGVVVAFDTAATNLLGDGTDSNAALDVFVRSVPFNADRVFEAGFE